MTSRNKGEGELSDWFMFQNENIRDFRGEGCCVD